MDQLLTLPVVRDKMNYLKAFDANIESCMMILGMPGTDPYKQQQYGDYLTVQQQQDKQAQSGALLNTIKLPRVLRQLADRLPKPNYESSLGLNYAD